MQILQSYKAAMYSHHIQTKKQGDNICFSKFSEGILHARLNIDSFKMESSLPWKRPNLDL